MDWILPSTPRVAVNETLEQAIRSIARGDLNSLRRSRRAAVASDTNSSSRARQSQHLQDDSANDSDSSFDSTAEPPTTPTPEERQQQQQQQQRASHNSAEPADHNLDTNSHSDDAVVGDGGGGGDNEPEALQSQGSQTNDGAGSVVVIGSIGSTAQERAFLEDPTNLGQPHSLGEIMIWTGQLNAAEALLTAELNPTAQPQQPKKHKGKKDKRNTDQQQQQQQQQSVAQNNSLPIAVSRAHAALLLAEALLVRLLVSGDTGLIEDGLQRVERAISLAEKSASSSKISLFSQPTVEETCAKHERTAFIAHAMLIRAALEGFQGRFIKAPLTFRSSWREFQSVPENTPSTLARAMREFGVGMFQLFLTFAPAAAQTMFRIVGFSPNRNRGIHSLHMAIRNGSWNWAGCSVVAHHLLLAAQAHRSKRESIAALQHAQAILKILSQHVNNFVSPNEQGAEKRHVFAFEYFECEVQRRSGEFAIALEKLDSVCGLLSDIQSPLYRLQFTATQLLFVQQRFDEAVCRLNVLAAPDSTYTAKVFSLVFLGACLGQLGDEQGARQAWERVVSEIPEAMKGDMDKMLTRKVVCLLGRADPRVAYYELLFCMGHIRAMKKEDVVGLCDKVLSILNDHKARHGDQSTENAAAFEELIAIHLICGVVHSYAGNLPLGMEHLKSVTDLAQTADYDRMVEDKFHAPHAWYEIGVLFAGLHRWEEAVQAFKNCESCSKGEFSFHRLLGYRERAAKKYAEFRLNARRKQKQN